MRYSTILSAAAAMALATAAVLPSSAQDKKLTLEDIYKNYEYSAKGVSAFRWAEDGHSFLTIEKDAATGGQNIVLNDISSGAKTVTVPASALIPEGWDHPLTINGYTWSPDGSQLMIYTDAQRVWRTAKRGNYWLYTPATGELRQLGSESFEPCWMQFAKFSPDGTKAAYVYKNNLYVENIADGSVRAVALFQVERYGVRAVAEGHERTRGDCDEYRGKADQCFVCRAFWGVTSRVEIDFPSSYSGRWTPVIKSDDPKIFGGSAHLLFKSRLNKRIRLNVKHLVREMELSIIRHYVSMRTTNSWVTVRPSVRTIIGPNTKDNKRMLAISITLVANQISRKARNPVAVRRNDDMRLTRRILKCAVVESVTRDVHQVPFSLLDKYIITQSKSRSQM